MAYAKFITTTDSNGKTVRYGPYYYKSVRTAKGKVRSIYLGNKSAVKNKKDIKRSGWENLKQKINALAGLF